MLLAFSVAALIVAAAVGVIAYADQHKRIQDPQRYAEQRCEGSLPKEVLRTEAFARCVRHEGAKSTLASVFPLLLLGVIATGFGAVGIVIGRVEVRRQRDLPIIFPELPDG
jgi:hypothetical protein